MLTQCFRNAVSARAYLERYKLKFYYTSELEQFYVKVTPFECVNQNLFKLKKIALNLKPIFLSMINHTLQFKNLF